MLYLSFSQLAYCLHFYPEEYLSLRNYCNRSSSKPLTFEDAWNILIQILPESSHAILETMKTKILMSLYTAVSYEQQKVEPKSCILNAYLKFESASEPESVKRTLSRCAHDLQQSTLSFSRNCHNYINFQYLTSYWRPDAVFKCLNPLDFYFYLKNYKHWALYPDNANGITFHEWFNGINSIITYDKNGEISIPETISLDEELSAYITEQLFHPIAFCKNVLDFCGCFGNDFYNDNFLRESAMRLFIPLSYLPVSWQDKIKGLYSDALENYIREPDNALSALHFGRYLKQIYFYAGCLESFAEIFLAAYLFPYDFKFVEDVLPTIKEMLSENITDTLNDHPDYSYHRQMNSYLKRFCNAAFPITTKERTILFSDNNGRKRNNHFIETFEINYTFFFFQAMPLYTLAQHYMTNNSFMSIEQYISQRSFWFYHFTPQPGYDTANYFRYKNKNAIILGPVKKTQKSKTSQEKKKN